MNRPLAIVYDGRVMSAPIIRGVISDRVQITLGGKPTNLRLPNSLNPGHEIGLVLDRLMLPYGDDTDFDTLPIPFRCVATDLVSAETVVLKQGSLAQSLRATMAIPAVFDVKSGQLEILKSLRKDKSLT